MHMNEYQRAAMSFRKPSADNVYAILGLMEEAGEVAGKFSKARRDGFNENFTKEVVKELGDVLWMIAAIASDLEVELHDVASENLTKLSKRKQNGTIGGSGDGR